ncbi:MAG: AsmA family protein [Acidobacteria bacterium]|nr:AsmA family protein [Acidobacteriota bacterium]MBI3662911.1 AsmA family protein [Acidobacteriota bacterium]
MTDSLHNSGTPRRKWLRRFAIAFFVWLVAHLSLLLLVSTSRVQRAFAARMTVAFGRPVEVSNFEISVLEGPRLVANYVTVSEDPRFGREHFLRAERLTAAIRWTALLRGRLEFDTVSFTRPSLNLVRNADGQWNLESWMPPPRGALGSPSPGATIHQTLFTRVNIDAGRINFKRGVDKHPFAFVNVEGFVERDSAGRWRVDLEASVMRAAVSVQEPGTIRLRGRIGSAASRLQPAELILTWQEASLSDALRLARGHDFGVRGGFELAVTASVPPPSTGPAVWAFNGDLRLRQVHGWDLPQRPSDPGLNLAVEAKWTPQQARVEFAKILLDAPQSNLRASGALQWARPQDSSFRVLSSGVSLNDLLDWYRAFRPGVAPGLRIDGNAGLDAELAGWPIAVRRAALATGGALIRVPGLRDPLALGRAILRWRGKPAARATVPRFELQLATLSLGPSRRNELRLDGSASPGASLAHPWDFTLNLAGQSDRAQDLLAASAAAGWTLDAGWRLDGGAALKLRWSGNLFPFAARLSGAVDLRGAVLRPPFLNEPLNLGNARIEWQSGERRVTLASAQALGARWSGTLRSPAPGVPWEFSLSADRLDVAAVNQWLNPARHQGLLQRLIPQGGAQRGLAEYEEQIKRLRARGRISVDQLTLAPVSLHKLRGTLELDGRNLNLIDTQADFYGGAARGSFRAELAAQPRFDIRAKFDRVNLASLAAATATLKNLFTGTAAGELSLTTRGAARADLLRSLEGQGTLEFRDAQFRGLDLPESVRANRARPGATSFRSASAQLRIASEKFQLEEFRLTAPSSQWEAEGTVDFARQLDLLLRAVPPPAAQKAAPAPAAPIFHLTGPLSAPQLVRSPPAKKP